MYVTKKITAKLTEEEITIVRQFISLLQELEHNFYAEGIVEGEVDTGDLKIDTQNFFKQYGVKL